MANPAPKYKRMVLTIEPAKRAGKLSKLKRRPRLLIGDVDDINQIDWMKAWRDQ